MTLRYQLDSSPVTRGGQRGGEFKDKCSANFKILSLIDGVDKHATAAVKKFREHITLLVMTHPLIILRRNITRGPGITFINKSCFSH